MADQFDPLSPPPRIVKPRTRTYKHLSIVAIEGNRWLNEDGETGTMKELMDDFFGMPSTLFVKRGAADWVAWLDEIFPPPFQWKASTLERDICRPDGERIATRVSAVIHFFGYKGRYHKVIDPVTMYGKKLDEVWPTTELQHAENGNLVKLLLWATTLRDFCDKNGLEVRPTIGAISSQFLTHSRFYPKKRRKVPAKINERVREVLPGNHYALQVVPSHRREFRAWYLDQHRAHHYHALTTALPDSNFLFAYGFFVNLDQIAFKNVFPNFHGLYCLDLEVPHSLSNPAHWDWLRSGEKAFVYSNELPHLYDAGYKVIGVRAAWGSHKRDTGLAKYAKWADKQLDHYGELPWLKPLLLATYGALATRPRDRETVFKIAKKGEPVTLVTGNNELNGLMVSSGRKLEPGIANVLHRGMIEAACRSESVGMAQWLFGQGFHVLSIYADAVIVKDDDETKLPQLPTPWRLKETLNHLQFINQQAFVSGEMTKLPGVSHEARRHHLPLARA